VSTAERLTDLAHLGSAVGHHVINAYSAIVSNAEILLITSRKGAVVDPAGIAELIIRTAVDASGVARRLIDYARPETITGESPVALNDLILEIGEEKQAVADSRIVWQIHAGKVPTIRGNVAQLNSMIGHLIANAEDALASSGGTITLSTGLDDRGWIVLEIRDTGPGMSAAVQERAVEPFFTTKAGHLGVGLSIANGIWRRHHGTLAIGGYTGSGAVVRLCVDPIEGGLSRYDARLNR